MTNAKTLTFSTITINNCLVSDVDDESIPLTLSVSKSFPSLRFDDLKNTNPISASWDALSQSASCGHLDLTLESSSIGEGRIGLAYSARVNAATDADGNDISENMPTEVCLKIAKPTYSRSLAREAWFYEQLQEWQGVATAKCHGFFTVPVPNNASVRPWKKSNEFPHKFYPRDYFGVNFPSADWLPDDPPSSAYKFAHDSFDIVERSDWYTWTPSKDEQVLSILVLEKLGPHYYSQEEEPKSDREALRESVREVVDDVCFTGVWHTDVTAYNILRVPPGGTQAICSKHQTSHDWRLVDFDRCFAIDRHCSNKILRTHLAVKRKVVGNNMCFWGRRKD